MSDLLWILDWAIPTAFVLLAFAALGDWLRHRDGRRATWPSHSAVHLQQGEGSIGHWLSREIARMHDGELTVESVPGRGSTFTLQLRLNH